MCDQQNLRSACAYAQSDQRLCLSLEYSMSVKLLTEHHLEFLSLKGGCTGSSESTLVKMPHLWGVDNNRLFRSPMWPLNQRSRSHILKYIVRPITRTPHLFFYRGCSYLAK